MKGSKFSISTLVLIAAINLYFLITIRIGGDNSKTIIYSDGKGYFEYLRAPFINHNLGKEDSTLGFIRITDSGPMIKFFSGTAIAYSPFFAMAYLQAKMNNDVDEGYSIEFQRMIAIAGWFYCLLGLFFTERLLKVFSVRDIIRAASLLIITYGTNLFYYAILEPSMTHVYAFACVAGFVFSAQEYFKTSQLSQLILASITLGLTIAIRPTNIIVLLMLPFIIDRKDEFFRFIKNLKHVLLSILIIGIFGFIQMLFWYLQTGKWIVWSYAGEGFYFTKPEIFNVLFSFNKGWFVYTPLAFVSMLGFIPLWKKNHSAAIAIALTLLAAIYITSAWWCWDYSNSFGMRPMIDFYSLIAILLAVLITSLQKFWTKLFAGLVLASVLIVTSIQTYQYYHHILQPFGMTSEKYRHIFLKTSSSYERLLGGNFDLKPFSKEPLALLDSVNNHFEGKMPHWSSAMQVPDPINSQNTCVQFDSTMGIVTYLLPTDSIIHSAEVFYFEISLRRMELSLHSSSQSKFKIVFMDGDTSILNYDFLINDYPDTNPMQWRKFNYAVRIRKQFKHYDTIQFEIENPLRQNFLIDVVLVKTYGVME